MARQSEIERHATEFEVAEHVSSFSGVTSTTRYAIPDEDYLCPCCQRFGHHIAEACYLFPRDEAPKGFGANKFGHSTMPSLEDIKTFKLFHTRVKN
jgi:hypothetical protein